MISTAALYRFAVLFLTGLCLLVFAGPVLDFLADDPAAILGWINNMAMGWALILVLASPAYLTRTKTAREMMAAGGMVLFVAWAALHTSAHTANAPVSLGGLVALGGALGGGFLAYALARDRSGLEGPIVITTCFTAIALPLAPALVALDPARHDAFWQNVYGFSNIRVLGYFAAALIAVASGALITCRKPMTHGLWLFLAAATGWAMMIWSGSRAGALAVITGLAISAGILKHVSRMGITAGVGAAAAGTLVALSFPAPDSHFGLAGRLSRTGSTILDAMKDGGTATETAARVSSGRIELWRWIAERIQDAPWAGHGYLPMSWMRQDEPPLNVYHSHNIILEYAVSFGIPAAAGILFCGIIAWIRAARTARALADPATNALFAFITVMTGYAMLSAVLLFPFHLMLFTMALGTLLGSGNSEPDRASRHAGQHAGKEDMANTLNEKEGT